MSATQRQPIIVVKRAWEEDAPNKELVHYVPISHKKEKKVVNFIPIDDGTRGIEHLMMQTYDQFDRHAKECGLKHQELFVEFTKCLGGSTLRYWQHILKDYADDADQVTANFAPAVAKLRDKVCGGKNMADTQFHYLQHKIKKPKNMTPREFLNRFTEIVDCSEKLEGLAHHPGDYEKKTWFYNAFPSSYRAEFQKAGLKVDDKSMEEVMEYFQALHDYEMENGQLIQQTNKRKREDDDTPRTSSKKQRGRDQRQQRQGNYYHRRQGNSNGERKSRWNEQCPLHTHLSHTWGECRSNPDSRNFRPQQGVNNSRRNGNGGGDNRNNSLGSDRSGNKSNSGRKDQGDVHYYEQHGSRTQSNKDSKRQRLLSHDDDDNSVASVHHIDEASQKRVTYSLFDEE